MPDSKESESKEPDFNVQALNDSIINDPLLEASMELHRIDPVTLQEELCNHPGNMHYFTAKHLEADAKHEYQKVMTKKLEGQAYEMLKLRYPKTTEKGLEHKINQDSRIIEQRERVITAKLEVGFWKSRIERSKEALQIMTTVTHDHRTDKKFIDPSRYIGTPEHREQATDSNGNPVDHYPNNSEDT